MESKASIVIRKATFDDAPDIFALGEKVFSGYGTEDWTFSLVAELLEKFPDFCLVSIDEKDDNKIAGFVLSKPFEQSRTKFYIYWVAVNPAYRGMGVGTGMVIRINEIAIANKYQSVIVDTGAANKGMQQILRKTGFKPLTEEVYFIKKFTATEKKTDAGGVKGRVKLKEKLKKIPRKDTDKPTSQQKRKGHR